MPRTVYTEQQKTEALDLYREHGPREAARQTGIDASLITRWAKAAGLSTLHTEQTLAATAQRKAQGDLSRAEARAKLLRKLHRALDRMDEPYVAVYGATAKRIELDEPPADAFRHLAVSAAVLIDKLRLEEGEVTARTETRSDDPLGRELERLAGELAAGPEEARRVDRTGPA
jgi:hypothetical protein